MFGVRSPDANGTTVPRRAKFVGTERHSVARVDDQVTSIQNARNLITAFVRIMVSGESAAVEVLDLG